MGKRTLQLYVDDECIQLAKTNNLNLSALFREMLNSELITNKKSEKDKINHLKLLNAKLSAKVKDLLKEIEILNKKTERRSRPFRQFG